MTPIGQRIPRKGTIRRDMAELNVRFRQAGRAVQVAAPITRLVPWSEVAETWNRRLERMGVAYMILVGVYFALLFTGIIR